MAHQHWAWLTDRATGERRRVPLVDAREADPALYEVAEHEEDGAAPHFPAAETAAAAATPAAEAAPATPEQWLEFSARTWPPAPPPPSAPEE